MAETLLDIIQQSINGLMYGAFYALIGIGFTLFFGVMKKFNLAYGPTIMAGIYLGLIPLYRWKAPMWVVFVTCVAGGGRGRATRATAGFCRIAQGGQPAPPSAPAALPIAIQGTPAPRGPPPPPKVPNTLL